MRIGKDVSTNIMKWLCSGCLTVDKKPVLPWFSSPEPALKPKRGVFQTKLDNNTKYSLQMEYCLFLAINHINASRRPIKYN